jgi:glycosyltransferase involved in cell wall biosynthesis
VAESLCRELKRQGVESAVLTRRYPGLPGEEEYDGVRVVRAGIPGRTKVGAAFYALDAIRRLASELRQMPVVHAHGTDTPLLIGLAARLSLGRRLILSIHTDPRAFLAGRGWRGRWRLRMANRLADRIISLSEPMHSELLALGVDPERVTTIPNGVDTRLFRPASAPERHRARARLGLGDDVLVFLFVGRLVRLKGVSELLSAWGSDRRPRRHLVIVGDGEEREALMRQATDQADVTFAGSQERVQQYLAAADVFVLPSSREGQSVALLEAMASGLCVVASDIPGNQSLFPDACLFQPENIRSLRDALAQVEDPDIRAAVAARARSRAESHSLQAMAASFRSLYRSAER